MFGNMIRQPFGCILVVVIGVIALALSTTLLWILTLLRPDLSTPRRELIAPALGLGLFIFFVLLEFAHRLQIRLFFRKRKLNILRIRAFKNHYRVEYEAGGKKVSGKWPKDFENWPS
jgi:hypothetical protein